MKALADQIPLECEDNSLAQIEYYVELAGTYIQQTVERHDHRLERAARAQAAAKAATKPGAGAARARKAKKEAAAGVELEKIEPVIGSDVQILD